MRTRSTLLVLVAASVVALLSLGGCTPDRAEAPAPATMEGTPVRAVPPPSPAKAAAIEYPPGYGPDPVLPEPFTSFGSKAARVVGWPEGRAPLAPRGFWVELYASGIESPRWLYALPNGDVLVAQSAFTPEAFGGHLSPSDAARLRGAGMLRDSPDRVALLRDVDRDGRADSTTTLVEGMHQPFGLLVLAGFLYVGATDALWRYPYREGQTRIPAPGEKLLDLPAGSFNGHWMRNVVACPDGSKLYVGVGSATNVDDEAIDAKDPRRATILELNPDGSGVRVFARGLRNATGMAWAPGTDELWTVANERDQLGEDLPPDFLTHVMDGAFYGWPYAYFGTHEDPHRAGERPDLVARAVEPDYALGAHTAPLGLVFYRGTAFPAEWRSGAFISQHGSINRSRLAGYRVIFVPFENGRPSGPPRKFLTGFVADSERGRVYGRPLGLAELPDGSLLVADDAADRIWRVSAK